MNQESIKIEDVTEAASFEELRELFARKVAVLDGAMGSMIQATGLKEEDFRGSRFAGHGVDLKGNYDLLSLTRPELIERIHRAYFEAGADMVETNTFNANAISQADYGLEGEVEAMNRAAVRLARQAARAAAPKCGRRCFVVGSVGPLNKTLSMSPDVNRPEYRSVNWAEVVAAYTAQIRVLVEEGVDALLMETIFDTLNAKAALFAAGSVFLELGVRLPLMLSVTITDAAGRTLSGQTPEAFYNSVRHAKPFSVGVNCGMGGERMRPFVEEFSRIAEEAVSCYPNAGMPNAFGLYDESPKSMAETLRRLAVEKKVNLVGGCCGSTPDHIRAIAEAVEGLSPRELPKKRWSMRLSGLEALNIG